MEIKDISVVIPTRNKRNTKKIKAFLKEKGFKDIHFIKDNGLKLYNRHFGALRAKNEWIYTQDDDCLVHNIDELIEKADKNKIITNIQKPQSKFYKKKENGEGNITLIGWGAIFHEDILNNIYKYQGELYELFFREFDRVLTYYNEFEEVITNKIEHLEGSEGKEALSQDKEHFNKLREIIKRL